MVLPDEIALAAIEGDVDVVRAFLAQQPERVDDVNNEDRTMLQLASLPLGEERERRSLELVQLLVAAGANVDRRINPEHEGPMDVVDMMSVADADDETARVRSVPSCAVPMTRSTIPPRWSACIMRTRFCPS